LTAKDRSIQTGFQVVFLNVNGRLSDIDPSQMEKGADRLTEMAATTFFGVNLDSHSSNPSLFRSANTNAFYFIKIFQNTPQLCWGDE
jgi:hypothetical protein